MASCENRHVPSNLSMIHSTIINISHAMNTSRKEINLLLEVEKASLGKGPKVGGSVKKKRFPREGVTCVKNPE